MSSPHLLFFFEYFQRAGKFNGVDIIAGIFFERAKIAVMHNIRTEASDVGDNFFSAFRMSAEYTG